MIGDIELAMIALALGIVAGAVIVSVGLIIAAGRIKKGLENKKDSDSRSEPF